MPKKCGVCDHQFCSHKDFVADTSDNRKELFNKVTSGGKLIHQCGCTMTRDRKHYYCCKCKSFVPLK